MRKEPVVGLCAASFVVGGIAQFGFARAAKLSLDPSMLQDSDTKAVGAKPDKLWHYVNGGGASLGVTPHQ